VVGDGGASPEEANPAARRGGRASARRRPRRTRGRAAVTSAQPNWRATRSSCANAGRRPAW
jgi:hypothetical protein